MFKKVSIILALVLLIITLISFATTHNKEGKIRNKFNQKIEERSVVFDNMRKIIKQTGQVSAKFDSSFTKNVQIAFNAREDKEGLMMKWIQETNPNATISEVADMYKNLNRTIEAQRSSFVEREIMLQDLKNTHDDLLTLFPSNIVCSILGKKPLEYLAITSDYTQEAVKTGKDNDINVF